MIYKMTDLEKSILATLAYYDIFDRPLTAWEIFRYLILDIKGQMFKPNNIKFIDILNNLDYSKELEEKTDRKNGFYFLKKRDMLVEERIERQKISDQKWKKVKRFGKFLQMIPYIRLAAVSGSLAMNHCRKESDFDLLIIAKAGRIWTCRTFTTVFFQIIGQRRHHKYTKDRFCLNHYITDQSLDYIKKNLTNAQIYKRLVPIIDTENLMRKTQQSNQWIKNYLLFYPVFWQGYLKKIKKSRFLNQIRQIEEFFLDNRFGDWLENFFKQIQIKRIKKNPMTYMSGGRVIYDDRQLEFHPELPEKKFIEKYNQKLIELGLKDS